MKLLKALPSILGLMTISDQEEAQAEYDAVPYQVQIRESTVMNKMRISALMSLRMYCLMVEHDMRGKGQ